MQIFDEYINFEWDDAKASINETKHNVTFEQATEVFSDIYARIVLDTRHSNIEERFNIIGLDLHSRTLFVCYCERNNGSTIRLISARKATKNEARQYWEQRSQ